MRTTILLLAWTVALAAGASTADRLTLNSRRITMTDGLPSNYIYDMVQDHQGFIWIGANYGLCRYDGYSTVNYYSLNEKQQKTIDANVGNLYLDKTNQLLWIQTATFTLACYDLCKGRFVDYTGRGDNLRSYRRILRHDGELWLFDPKTGVRHITYGDGRFTCEDYNKENGKLPTNQVNRLIEHPVSHELWALTGNGLFIIGRNGQVSCCTKGNFVEGNTDGKRILCLRDDNTIDIYDNARQHRRIAIPAPLGTMGLVRSNFVWQQKWLIFGNGTFALDLKTHTVSKPESYQFGDSRLLDSIDGYFFESDKSGRLLLFPPQGPPRELPLMPEMRFTSERQRKYYIVRGTDKRFYISSYGNGLFVYDPENGTLEHFSANDEQPVIDTNFLLKVMADDDGNIWVVQDAMGLACISASRQADMKHLLPAPEHKGDGGNFVRMMAEKRDGNIIIGTRDNKLYQMDRQTQTFQLLCSLPAAAYSYYEDSQGHIWIATRGAGLIVDGQSYTRQDATHHCPTNDLYDIVEDQQGRIWIATYEDGLLMTRYTQDRPLVFKQLLNRNINEGRQHQLTIDRHGRLWVSTHNGLYTVDTHKRNIGNADFICYNRDNSRLPFNETRCVMYGSGGWLWTGGKGSGTVRCRFDQHMKMTDCQQTTDRQGLANNNVSSMVEDPFGHVWIGTENGLSRIDDDRQKAKTFRQPRKQFERDIYSESCALCLNDGTIAMGTRNGLTLITPHKHDDTDLRKPTVSITDISINGTTTADSNRFELAPNRTDHITLAHNENTLALAFSNFEYADLESSLYQFYLEGADTGWRPLTSVNHVEYSHLKPGSYTFHLRTQSNNQWSDECTLNVTIRQPWYNTWWAWMLYLLAGAGFTYYIYRNARERLRLHQQMKLEQQLTKFRMDFFTNVAHEFRTPLAIISGAVDKMNKSETYNRSAAQTARRGTRRLLRLVNQLMEFRKLNTGNVRLQVEEGDFIAFVRDIYQDFWNIAKQKDMQFTFTPFEKSYRTPFDRQMVETMVYNLLSNAVKYGAERGTIAVRIKRNGDQLHTIVEDNGPGISKEQQEQLFQPFMKGYASQGGMGIGLYTAHEMARLHKGDLSYRRDGELSVFTITLPATADAYQPEDYRRQTAVTHTTAGESESEEIIRELQPEAYNDLTVVIIEDHPDMMEQIKAEIGVYFKTKSFANGLPAVEYIREELPSLVVCDVMLPDTNGYDITSQLKNDPKTAHIPVIMLTALDDESHQLRSYKSGADDYMVKPCNYRLLIGRIVQLIKKSEQLRHDLRQQQKDADTTPTVGPRKEQANASPLITSQTDKVFLEKLQMSIAQHISDPDFTVDQLAAQLNMGRTKFYNKTKELTGMSPNKYLMNQRMELASRLLLEGELTVGEVSYRIGLADASYFNKCFKQHFGIVPSKYGKSK